MGSIRGAKLRSEAKQLARLGIGEMSEEVRLSPGGCLFGCLNLLWNDVQIGTGSHCSHNMIQKKNESLLMTLGCDSHCDLALEILFIFKGICSLIFLFPKGNIIDSVKSVSPDIVMYLISLLLRSLQSTDWLLKISKREPTIAIVCQLNKTWELLFLVV